MVTVNRLGGFVPSGLVGEIGEVGLELVELPHPLANVASRTTAPTVNGVESEHLKDMFRKLQRVYRQRQVEPSRQRMSRKEHARGSGWYGVTGKSFYRP
jgi:hypothetical protein